MKTILLLFLPLLLSALSHDLKLSSQEISYLEKKKELKLCVDPNWMPYTGIRHGNHIGLAADIFKIIDEKISIPIKLQQSSSWSQTLEFAKEKRCDIIDFATKTPNRENYLIFTTNYLKMPIVIATKNGVPFIDDFKKLKKRIGIVKGYAFAQIIKKDYPNITVVDVKSTEDGLKKVKSGEIFGHIGALSTIAYILQREFTGELKITGKLNETWKMGSAVRKDEPILLSILQKALDSIDETEIDVITNKWIAIRYEKGTDYTLIWQILFIAILIITATLYWTTKLSFLNKQLKLAKEKSDEATKAKANFLANMSHELKTPMNSIVGMSYLLNETKLNDAQANYVHKIEESSNNLLSLINDILDFSKIEARKLKIKKVAFNLLELINNVENMLKLKAHEKDLEFAINYDKAISLHLYGDNLRLSQVLTNLISNAIKFTHKGKVELNIEKIDIKRYRFSVCDTGIGLTQEQIKDIFSSFTQADSSITRKYGGTGLGLAISKELVELMNGKVWVESIFGQGSKFIFEIELEESNKNTIKQQKTLIKDICDIKDARILIDKDKAKELFANLKEAAKKRRPQLCEPILQEFSKYNLDKENQELFDNVNQLIKKYKFDDARKLL